MENLIYASRMIKKNKNRLKFNNKQWRLDKIFLNGHIKFKDRMQTTPWDLIK
jgi:hypothetical protein